MSILSAQLQLSSEFEDIYRPIIGASESDGGPEYAETPAPMMTRASRLRETYEELKGNLLDEVNLVDLNLVRPAMDAKDSIQPMKKVIKKREDRKVRHSKAG